MLHIEDKVFRKLEQEWNALIKDRNYVFPKTREEYQEQFNRKTLSIEVDFIYQFLCEGMEKRFCNFIDTIASSSFFRYKSETHRLRDILSLGNIHSIVIHELQVEIKNRRNRKNNKRTFLEVQQSIQSEVSEKFGLFNFFFVVKGMTIEDSITVDFEHLELFVFEQRDRDSFLADYERRKERVCRVENIRSDVDRDFLNHIKDFIDKKLLGHTCVRASAYGDRETSEKIAYKQTKEIINYFRYLICLMHHERISENILKISLSFEAYSDKRDILSLRNDNSDVALSFGRGRRHLQKFLIDKSFLYEIDSKAFLDDFIVIANSKKHTEIEGCILTAVYWIGEAQDEFDLDVSFLKYWTALECIFTRPKDKYVSNRDDSKRSIATDLAEGAATINFSLSGDMVCMATLRQMKKDLKRLYARRSDIVHRGMNYLAHSVIDETDISNLCRYAAMSVHGLFCLRSQYSYKNKSELDSFIDSQYARYTNG